LGFSDDQGLWFVSLDLSDPDRPKPGTPEKFLGVRGAQWPAFSPDGHWIAYMSPESGNAEVYVRPYGTGSGKWPISLGGGRYPVWSRGGRQLFYGTLDNYPMVVDYTASGDTFSASKPRRWSDTPIGNATGSYNFDVSPDGKRLVAVPISEYDELKGNLHLTFLLNFFDEVKRRMP
jgi:Tol biopolymer transport system component